MEINNLQSELSRFHLSLPPEYKFNDQNIAKYMASEDRVAYGYLHSHLGASHVDLYRFSLPGVKDTADEILRRLPREFVLLSQKQAVAHAICLAEYFEAIRAEYAKHPSTLRIRLTGDYSLPHMCTQAIRVLLVAISHRLYEGLAGKTTVPPWRGLNTRVFTEEDLRRMITNMVVVMEPWQHIFSITKHAVSSRRSFREQERANMGLCSMIVTNPWWKNSSKLGKSMSEATARYWRRASKKCRCLRRSLHFFWPEMTRL